jgi:hypothetical protein
MSARGTSFAMIWIYWSSLLWLRPLFGLLGITPRDHAWLVRMLEIYYWPVLALIPRMARLFRYAGWPIVYAPLVAPLVGAVLCTAAWWVWFTTRRRMERRQVYQRPF